MRNFIFTVPGGGIFSRFLQFAVLPLAEIEFDNAYLVMSEFAPTTDVFDPFCEKSYEVCMKHVTQMKMYGIENPYEHIMNYVLDQTKDDSYVYGGYLKVGRFYGKENKIELSPRFYDYKQSLSKLKIKNEIYQAVDEYVINNTIGKNTLGVHVRLTTMNMLHHDLYQQVTIDDYIKLIKLEMKTGLYDKIFVASDNHESINKLIHEFGDLIIYHHNFYRYKTEIHKDFFDSIDEYEWFYLKDFWQQSFRDCMVLAKCKGLVCRESNFSNMAILFSDTLNRIQRVYHNV